MAREYVCLPCKVLGVNAGSVDDSQSERTAPAAAASSFGGVSLHKHLGHFDVTCWSQATLHRALAERRQKVPAICLRDQLTDLALCRSFGFDTGSYDSHTLAFSNTKNRCSEQIHNTAVTVIALALAAPSQRPPTTIPVALQLSARIRFKEIVAAAPQHHPH